MRVQSRLAGYDPLPPPRCGHAWHQTWCVHQAVNDMDVSDHWLAKYEGGRKDKQSWSVTDIFIGCLECVRHVSYIWSRTLTTTLLLSMTQLMWMCPGTGSVSACTRPSPPAWVPASPASTRAYMDPTWETEHWLQSWPRSLDSNIVTDSNRVNIAQDIWWKLPW